MRKLIPYASRTGTKKNLLFLKAHGWHLMVSAKGVLRTEGFRYSLDNGAWTAYQRNKPFDTEAYIRAVDQLGSAADFIVLPDIVCGGLTSLQMSLSWLPYTRTVTKLTKVLIPVQDGMLHEHVEPFLSPKVGLFVGGSTEWKEATIPYWAALAHRTSAYCHVGRVNSRRRIRMCGLAGVDSFDGSGPSRFIKHAETLQRELDLLITQGKTCPL